MFAWLRLVPVLLIALLLAACGSAPVTIAPTSAPAAAPEAPAPANPPVAVAPASEGAYPRTVVDGAGREITLAQRPERVVALYNGNFGMLATLGILPVGVLANPEMLSDPIYLGGAGGAIHRVKSGDSIDLEDVAGLRPDLIMASSIEEAQAMEGIAPVYIPPQAENMAQVYDSLRNVAALFALEAEAEEIIAAFEARYAAYASLAPKDIAVLKLAAGDSQVFYVGTVQDPICQILAAVAQCDWQNPTSDEYWSYETNIEGVLALDPDVIILNNWSSATREDMLAALADDALWNELQAVQNGRVVGTPGYENPIASSLPAAQKFLDTYMPQIYPDVFPTALTEAQVQEIAGN
jgi:iron complex transport system substrate-binding protein